MEVMVSCNAFWPIRKTEKYEEFTENMKLQKLAV